MIPLRDNIPSRRFPLVNLGLIALNARLFWLELSLGKDVEPFLMRYGLVPARFAHPALLLREGPAAALLPVASSMFLHGGWMHFISNMWVLYIFGDNVEDRLGHLRYLIFYLCCGLAAAGTEVWFTWGSAYPMIGASGAIAGVMGAYFLLFPRARVLTLVPILFLPYTFELPAFIFLGFWAATQYFAGRAALLSHAQRFGGVAWWAHVGGFLAGMVLLLVFKRKKGTPY